MSESRPLGDVRHFKGAPVAQQGLDAMAKLSQTLEGTEDHTSSTMLVRSAADGDTDTSVPTNPDDLLIDRMIYHVVDLGLAFEATRQKLKITPEKWVALRSSQRFLSRYERGVASIGINSAMKMFKRLDVVVPGMSAEELNMATAVVLKNVKGLSRFETTAIQDSSRRKRLPSSGESSITEKVLRAQQNTAALSGADSNP